MAKGRHPAGQCSGHSTGLGLRNTGLPRGQPQHMCTIWKGCCQNSFRLGLASSMSSQQNRKTTQERRLPVHFSTLEQRPPPAIQPAGAPRGRCVSWSQRAPTLLSGNSVPTLAAGEPTAPCPHQTRPCPLSFPEGKVLGAPETTSTTGTEPSGSRVMARGRGALPTSFPASTSCFTAKDSAGGSGPRSCACREVSGLACVPCGTGFSISQGNGMAPSPRVGHRPQEVRTFHG